MKNIHILPTDQPTGIFETNSGLQFSIMNKVRHGEFKGFHIYITSDEVIEEGDWFHLDMSDNDRPDEIHQMGPNKRSKTGGISFLEPNNWTRACKKIILTTAPDLIADGVQSIDDNFLEWFVKNPSCEKVEVIYDKHFFTYGFQTTKYGGYKITIPQEEPKQETHICKYCDAETTQPDDECYAKPKQETLEEAAYRLSAEKFEPKHIGFMLGVIEGAKWQAERMFSEEDLREAFKQSRQCKIFEKDMPPVYETFDEWFEQFKKK
jgi:hypothetical protein